MMDLSASCEEPNSIVKPIDDISTFQYFSESTGSSMPSPNSIPVNIDLYTVAGDSSATLEALDLLDSDASSVQNPETHRKGKVKMSSEEKKRRNRDCMRRLRNRRNDLLVDMRSEIQSLESTLHQQQLRLLQIQSQTVTNAGSQLEQTHTRSSQPHTLPQFLSAHAHTKTILRTLREENYWLQKQITQRSESMVRVEQLLEKHHHKCPQIDVDALEEDDIGVWIRNTDHFVPLLDHARACAIVLESYAVIQDGIRITQSRQPPPNTVLGWADQRSVDAQWAQFTMRKTFPHESTRTLALKTWQMLSNVAQISVLQPKSHQMKVVQRLNDSTLVVARHTYFPQDKVSYCMVYLLFLLETDDGGYVIGTRSLDPDAAKMNVFTSDRMTVARPFHCFRFQDENSRGGGGGGEGGGDGGGGATLTFAGRVDNVDARFAKNCAMDMLLAMMRWESHCVAPLWRLADG